MSKESLPCDGPDGADDVIGEFDVANGPWVPEGEYELAYQGHKTVVQFGSAAKLALRFKICQPGPYFGVCLWRYYNVKRLLGAAKTRGRFIAKPRGDFAIEYFTLFPHQTRLDRVSLKPLRSSIVIGHVKTVTQNAVQRDLPRALQYSVIDRLIRIKPL